MSYYYSTIQSGIPLSITSVTADGNITTIDGDESTTLTANGVSGIGAIVTWYTGPGGTGTNLGTGLTKVVSPGNGTITYYARVTGAGTPVESSLSITGRTVYYVRPTAAGAGDGTSFDNAWSPSTINWTTVGSNILALCGTFNAVFTVGSNECTLKGNSPYGACIIDGQNTRATGITQTDKTGVLYKYITSNNHTTDNILLQTSIGSCNAMMYNCTTNGSGNQGVQHLGAATSIIYDHTANNNLDEAISLHDTSQSTIYRGQFRNNTSAFVNVSSTATTVNIYDVWDTLNNGVDLEGNGGGCIFNVYNSRITKCFIPSGCTMNFYNSYIKRSPNSSNTGVGRDDVFGTLRLVRCIIDGTGTSGTSAILFDMQSGSTLRVQNSTFINMPLGIYALGVRAGVTLEGINNSIFYGTSGVGRGIFRGTNFTVNNCIFRDLQQVDNNAGITYNYCSITNSGTVFGTQTNSVNSNPLFTNPSALDFSVQVGSPMLNAGTNLGVAWQTGVGTGTNWGSNSAAPVVVETNQTGSWDIGAYVT